MMLCLLLVACASMASAEVADFYEMPHFLQGAPAQVIADHAKLIADHDESQDLAPLMDQWVNKQGVFIRVRKKFLFKE